MANMRVTRTRPTAPSGTAVAYLRVSTTEQSDSGLGLDAQRRTIEAYAEARGLTIVEWFEDAGVSGGTAPTKRPAMSDALDALANRQAETLLAAKLDRISRSLADAVDLDRIAARQGWRITTADQMVDTTTPAGRAAMNMLRVFSEFERDMISQRTREALAEKRAQGVQLGTPSKLTDAVVERICRAAYGGASLRSIGSSLEADGVQTSSGSTTWHANAVRRVLDGRRGRAITAHLEATDPDHPAA
ncbi:recombinase family protein [Gordonia sp. ABSL11-1]|uniref:recombinase family protein n=1 Tax=Gordonia sp. ABSL11-1 TaxID=3053924 RepID=UPI0025745A60|nr:recombinase family protein [Gordonia sp. ABSL11-1]MDL9947767.1 recombinase family protein [Gordonia sp. ABSL11-1]